jgi:hypothetical protein
VRKAPDTFARLLHYLAAYSAQCTVLAPAWLRKQAVATLRELRERYD